MAGGPWKDQVPKRFSSLLPVSPLPSHFVHLACLHVGERRSPLGSLPAEPFVLHMTHCRYLIRENNLSSFICPSTRPPTYTPIHLSIPLSTRPSVHLSIHPSTHPSPRLSIHCSLGPAFMTYSFIIFCSFFIYYASTQLFTFAPSFIQSVSHSIGWSVSQSVVSHPYTFLQLFLQADNQ